MTAALALHPRFPNLAPRVAQGYLDAPPHLVAEVVDGELSLMPRPRTTHARAAGELFGELRSPFGRGRDGWIFLIEPELHLGRLPDIVVPDLSGWRRERMPELPDEAAITLAPDWVCEVLSPSTEALDRGAKMRVWRREKVGQVWLLDPALKTLEVYRWSAEGYLLVDTHAGDVTVRAEPFEALALPLPSLWAR